ncbi:MAG: HEPN domain-containing protein [Armatimonadetes bacterium]|nr:HEPN domain-containing protein [Armatimonadota bacterium]
MQPLDQARREVVRQWLADAEEDYRLADHLLRTAVHFAKAIASNSQQAAEKYLKAFLAWHQVEFPKTHDIAELLGLVATVDPTLAANLAAADSLTPFAVKMRYPHPAKQSALRGAANAVAVALTVREAVLAALKPHLGE